MLFILLLFGYAETINLQGSSMEQYGLYGGERATIVLTSKVNEGDLVAFSCTDVCPRTKMIKKLIYKNGDCYWFQGRDGVWKIGEETRHSLDSRVYGWVCEKDIKIYGYVYE